MVLTEFYKRHEVTPVEDLSNDGVGITGVGDKLLEELFEPKMGLSPDLVAAIEEFTAKKREKEHKVKDLEAKAAAGGVKGAAATNELSQLQASGIFKGERGGEEEGEGKGGEGGERRGRQEKEEQERGEGEASEEGGVSFVLFL